MRQLGTLLLTTLAAASAACGGGSGGGTAPAALSIRAPAAASATRGSAYQLPLDAEGGSGSGHVWRLVAGPLPPGLGLSAAGACLTWSAFAPAGAVDDSLGGNLLDEVSGIAVSRRNPGILWVHDDSGAPASLHALDDTGAVRQRYDLAIAHVDWEDIALGPGPDPTAEYLYIGDFGDNGSTRTDARIVRVEEPIVPASPTSALALPHEAFYFRYPGGARDAEALLVDWATGTPYVCEKNAAGGDVFKFPMPLDPARTAANPVQLLAVTTGRPLPGNLTAGDATRDGRRVALRGYGLTGWELRRPVGAAFDALFSEAPCAFSFAAFQQYEALAFGPSGLSLVTTTERAIFPAAPIHAAAATIEGASILLHGSPTAAGSYVFEVEVRDDAGAVARRTITLDVGS